MSNLDQGKPEDLISQLETRIYDPNNQQKAGDIFKWLHNKNIILGLEKWNTSASDHEIISFYTRIAACLQHFFLDPQALLDAAHYTKLVALTPRIHYIFYLSGFENSHAIKTLLRNRSASEKENRLVFHHKSDAHKYFLLLHPFSDRDTEDLISFIETSVESVFYLTVNFLNTRISAYKRIENNKKRVLDVLSRQKITLPASFPISNFHLTWAMSSYMDTDVNRKTKRFLNTLLKRFVENSLSTTVPTIKHYRLELDIKPRLLILAEVMKKEHVMYRCFGLPLAKLRDHFHVTVLTGEEDRGKGKWDWCDELVTFKVKELTLTIMVDRIHQLKPDVIVYPSIGMKMWALILSRIRLASLQVCLLGHPDLPFSEHIDYVIGGHDLVNKKSGQLISLEKTPGSLFNFIEDKNLPEPTSSTENQPVRIAVCANIFKLTPPFTEVCKRIQSAIKTPVEWYFFQNLQGIHYQIGKKQILTHLGSKNIEVFPSQKRSTYYELLGTCDLYLSPFPFGGENSTLDALLMGLPVVSKVGEEPRERLDHRILKTAGLENEMSVSSEETYLQKAIEFIENDELRHDLQQKIQQQNVQSRFMDEATECLSELSETIRDLYHNLREK